MCPSPGDPLDVLRDLLAKKTRIDRERIHPSSRLVDFGIDSVRAMEIVVDLERIFAISIPDQDLMDIESLQDIAAYVQRRRTGT